MSEQNVQVSQALEPCPCGAAPEHGFVGDEDGCYGYVECHENGMSVIIHAATETEAIAAWNHRTRAEPDLVEVAVAALHPAWFASDYNHREAQRAVRSALTRANGEGDA